MEPRTYLTVLALVTTRLPTHSSIIPRAGLDRQTASIIIHLQLEDLNEISSDAKRKQKERHINDFSIALAFFEGDFKTLSDRSFTRSIYAEHPPRRPHRLKN